MLLFRGHRTEDLWVCDFEDMAHLLIWGSLPTDSQREELRANIAEVACSVPESVHRTVQSFPVDSAAMPMIVAGMAAYQAAEPSIMPAYNAGNTYHKNNDMVDLAIVHALAVYSVVVGLAMSHRKRIPFNKPRKEYSFLQNLLLMIGQVDAEGKPSQIHLDCLKRVGSMGADHEITNSTFSLLVTASSLADPVSCLISAISSGYGPLHMGACESAYKSMQKIGGPQNAHKLINAVKARKTRLYGYGHRVWRTVDPRIGRMKSLIDTLGANTPDTDPVLATAMEIDRLASTDEYFTSRDLHANVDLFVVFFGIAMGFPADFIPVMIVCMRLPGYMAHWRESMNRDIKLFRPAGMYTGPTDPLPNPFAVPTDAEIEAALVATPELDSDSDTASMGMSSGTATPVNDTMYAGPDDLAKGVALGLENLEALKVGVGAPRVEVSEVVV